MAIDWSTFVLGLAPFLTLEGITVFIAFIYALIGYIAAKRTAPKTEFDPKMFGRTLLIGAIVGLISSFTGLDYTQLTTWASSGFFVVILQKITDALSKP